MREFFGWMPRIVSAMSQGPWGGKGSGGGDGGESGGSGDDGSGGSGSGNGGSGSGGSGGGPRNPWTQPRGGGRPGDKRNPSAIDELLRRGREGFGGGGFNLPQRPDGKPLWPLAVGILLIIWLALTCVHRIGPQERGVVLMLGKYSRTLSPGIGLTLPSPLESVETVDVEEIRTIDIGSAGEGSENLMLTGDQNIIDLAYSVRWNIRNPEQYKFQLVDPDATIREVAESAMRSVVASVSLDDALGAGRTGIEQQVEQRMQEILDGYRAGVRVQGIAIKQADPPSAVNDAFKDVSAAQQTAQTYLNEARAYAQQQTARAQGEAAAFDKTYEQYRLAPEVTRRRMYYETMEEVLPGIDKTIVETGNVTPYLPLPELRRRAAPAVPAPTTSVEAPR
ncbi:FtsH protease activity modulator HflK [Sphingobium sp. H39-3-25]|uniref:FtsH protease activity modulator HflK n=1 Tax=Sphingobium arseniciresistens TaxID=3030834 RepID=UPI0023B9E610|nr:FtsH protease activity modulator HflK [Sphingobium arseniciresistens]